MFAEDANGKAHEVKVDPAHVDRQARDLRAAGHDVVVMGEDERIAMGQLAQRIAAQTSRAQDDSDTDEA
jgi:hypothetical protein